MAQVLDAAQGMDVDAHWALMRDNRNLQSDVLRPLLVEVLQEVPEQADLAALLAQWDGVDNADSPAPLIYQALYREVALGTFSDELGDSLAPELLATWYFWQQRFDALLAEPENPWFDDVRSPQRETLADVIRAAAPRARALLVSQQGDEPANWRWGRAHTLRFASPLRRTGVGSGLAGGFSVQRPGGGETLNRGVYAFNKPFSVEFFASMRLVVDFADDEKIEAVLAGGINERHLQPQQNAQAKLWAAGERRPCWFSEQAVRAHAVIRLLLVP
jgi:penicillin amidase